MEGINIGTAHCRADRNRGCYDDREQWALGVDLGLGHDAIFRVADHYIRRGGITLDELEDLNKYLYKPYKEMGGNGTAETAMEKCKELPIITTAEAEKRDREMYKKGDPEQ